MGAIGSQVKHAERIVRHVDKQRRCPRCNSNRLYPSQGRGAGEKLLAGIGGERRRCHSCRARACWFGFNSIRLGDSAKEGSVYSGVAVVFGCAVCLALLLWVITRLTQLN
jgi:hypothetical protein